MTHIMRKIWQLPFILLLALWAGGCSSDDPSGGSQLWEGDLCLLLDVRAIDGDGSATRADEIGFEKSSLPTEGIHSLRIIMVNKTDTRFKDRIVHNYYSVGEIPENIKFKVDFDTRYRIYLIANEDGIPGYEEALKDIFTKRLLVGNTYPDNILENLELTSTTPGMPIIDNTEVNENATDIPASAYIPITESDEITTEKRPASLQQCSLDEDNDLIILSRKLFITRAASKFSFYFYKKTQDNGDDWTHNELKISQIKITGLGEREYLFPYNTSYSPTKYDQNSLERQITSFMLPGEGSTTGPKNNTGDYKFDLPTPWLIRDFEEKPLNFDDQGNEIGVTLADLDKCKNVFSPQLYFPDSKGTDGKFQCAIILDGENGEEFFDAKPLPNLSTLPRNTHVKVVITISMQTHEIEATVTLVPYIGVTLEPIFGTDELVPVIRHKDEDNNGDNGDNPEQPNA